MPSRERLHRIAAAAGEDIESNQARFVEEGLDEGAEELDEYLLGSSDDDIIKDVSTEEFIDYDNARASQKEEENELRRTVQAVFELEEALLNQHMSNIQVTCCGGLFCSVP